ncbi:type II secretion system protein [Planctomycetota bacterium]
MKSKPQKSGQASYRFREETKTNRLGFTLIELLVVIGIISLLLSILMPSLIKARSMAMRMKCAHNLNQINVAMNLFLIDNKQTYPCADDPVSDDPNNTYWLWMGRGWRGHLEKYLGNNINVDNPSVLLCPQDFAFPEKYQSTSYGYSMAFYHSPAQIDAMSSPADTYSNPQPGVPQQSFDVAHPAGKIMMGEWSSNHFRIKNAQERSKGWWTWHGRRNFLFADGHVIFLKATDIREANDGLPDVNLTVRGIKGIDWPR